MSTLFKSYLFLDWQSVQIVTTFETFSWYILHIFSVKDLDFYFKLGFMDPAFIWLMQFIWAYSILESMSPQI